MVKNCIAILRKIHGMLTQPTYDNFSISEYFRSQGAQIGDDCYFGISQLAGEPYLVRIGNHVQISSNVQLLTHNPGWCLRREIPDLQVFGKITIDDNCYIGASSIILPGVTIGPNTIIGAGSVVTKDIPPNSIAAGNPARVIGSIEEYNKRAMELWSVQRPQDYLSGINLDKVSTSKELHRLFHLPENRAKLRTHLLKLFQGSNKVN